jgi:hypothetical protein
LLKYKPFQPGLTIVQHNILSLMFEETLSIILTDDSGNIYIRIYNDILLIIRIVVDVTFFFLVM